MAGIHGRLAERQPIRGDDLFPGRFARGTPVHASNIGPLEAPEMSAFWGQSGHGGETKALFRDGRHSHVRSVGAFLRGRGGTPMGRYFAFVVFGCAFGLGAAAMVETHLQASNPAPQVIAYQSAH